jgi:sugar phosphate isomerase/epimerase
MTEATTARKAVPRIGLSTAGAGRMTDLGALAGLGPDSLEVCACGPGEWPRVARFIRSASLPVGLHCPVPYEGRLREFQITGPTSDGRRVALDLVRRTLEAAVDASAAYVVVHFPTPHPRPAGPSRPEGADGDTPEALVDAGARLAELQQLFGVPLFVENLSYHPRFGSATDYRAFFEAFPTLRMCLDVGHAHTSIHGEDVYDFVARTGEFISSVHLYNTQDDGPDVGRHHVPLPAQAPGDGWIDLPRLMRALARHARPEYVVLEHVTGQPDAASAYASTRWLRQLTQELPWN